MNSQLELWITENMGSDSVPEPGSEMHFPLKRPPRADVLSHTDGSALQCPVYTHVSSLSPYSIFHALATETSPWEYLQLLLEQHELFEAPEEEITSWCQWDFRHLKEPADGPTLGPIYVTVKVKGKISELILP